MIYEIFCDGATSGNGKADAPGGWAYVILKDGHIVSQNSGCEKGTTNQRMELTAALEACKEIDAMDGFATVKLYSDSAYLINCFKQNWWKAWRANGWRNSKKEPVANQDLWEQLITYFMRTPGYDFIKVPGHAGNEWNEYVDKMAVGAKQRILDRGGRW